MKINELYQEAVAGNEISRKQLFLKLSENFFLFVQHRLWDEQESRDVVQDALATIAAKYTQIEFETSFSAWAYQVLQNKMLNYYRSNRYRNERFVPMTNDNIESGSLDIDPGLKSRLLKCLKEISELNLRHARIVNLSYQGFQVVEICDRLSISSANYYKMLSRARDTLKRCLARKAEGHESLY